MQDETNTLKQRKSYYKGVHLDIYMNIGNKKQNFDEHGAAVF